ncbi:MAG: Gfo/Idh/MocA family oxidoreductase [Lachnospiraceae bacterium]|nr:Gfo/Idh/MocA family oxidoreductase [Lachnospiraceae bacterium]
MTKDGRIGYAIIGCGMISGFHGSAIDRIPEAELVGVCGFDPQESLRGAERFGAKPYLSRDEIWKDDQVDAVCVCTPSGLHGEIALEAVTHGRHVLIEKPMAMTLEECDLIIQAAAEQKVLAGVVSQLRYSPSIRYVKQVMDEGGLGRLIGADLYMKYYRSQEYYDSSPWRGTRSLDGGALMNQGIHGVDLLRYINYYHKKSEASLYIIRCFCQIVQLTAEKSKKIWSKCKAEDHKNDIKIRK